MRTFAAALGIGRTGWIVLKKSVSSDRSSDRGAPYGPAQAQPAGVGSDAGISLASFRRF